VDRRLCDIRARGGRNDKRGRACAGHQTHGLGERASTAAERATGICIGNVGRALHGVGALRAAQRGTVGICADRRLWASKRVRTGTIAPVALASRGRVSARGALDAIALAAVLQLERRSDRADGGGLIVRDGHGMRRCLWSGSGRAEQRHGIDTVARFRCGRRRCSRAVAGFRIAGLEQRFPDSDEIAGRRREREPR
jgi:hypothetical protein